MPPDFLAIGHVAKDLSPDGFRIGGAVTYAALTALGIGLTPAVVTSAGPELDLRASLPGVQVHTIPSRDSTTFVNSYHEGRRSQTLKSLAAPLGASDVPDQWRSAPAVLLAPLAGEVSYELAARFPDAVVLASIQGWLRQWDDEGRVSPAHWDGAEVLSHVDAVSLSIHDLGDRRSLGLWRERVRVLIVTMGSDGASLHFDGSWHHIEPVPAREVDATGAGDVFAAAYLIRYCETENPLESARFASCAASLCVEAEGVSGIPTRAQVEERLDSLPQ